MATPSPASSPSTSTTETRLQLANCLFRQFFAACFWHCRPDLIITEEMLPTVVRGLRNHGGREGLLAAARLTSLGESSDASR